MQRMLILLTGALVTAGSLWAAQPISLDQLAPTIPQLEPGWTSNDVVKAQKSAAAPETAGTRFVAGTDALDVYGYLTGKTVLMPSALPRLPEPMIGGLPSDRTNAIPMIERALAELGIEVVQDGPHFVRVFRKEARNSLTNAPLRGAELARAKGPETMPQGMIDFTGADLNQVLSIYAQLKQRTILRPGVLPGRVIHLKTKGVLTRGEVLYAMETVLALNGISVVDDGVKFVQVVPVPQRAQTRAPKPEPGARLFDPNKVPSIGTGVSVPPRNEIERVKQEFERLRKVVYDFMHVAEPNKRSPQRLLELYARLADKTAVASTNFDRVPIFFHVETPLTRAELLYAIETTIELNNLAIIPVDERRIRLGRMQEVLRNNGGRLERVRPKSAD